MPDIKPFANMAQEDTLLRLLMEMVRLVDGVGVLSPDTAGRLRVVLDTGSSISTITTVSGVTTVSTVSVVNNIASIGGVAANLAMQGLTLGTEGNLRRNIVIT